MKESDQGPVIWEIKECEIFIREAAHGVPMDKPLRLIVAHNVLNEDEEEIIVAARKTEPRYYDCLLCRGVGPHKIGGFDHLGETGDSPYGSIFTANPINIL